MSSQTYDWSRFLQRSTPGVDAEALRTVIEGKRIAITGAGGFIGSALALALARFSPARLMLLDIAEHGLHNLHTQLPTYPCDYIVGDICDTSLLDEVFSQARPQIVFHAAATKHVWLMEHNPFAAARTNALGTQHVLAAASRAQAEQFLLISTDKAVDPSSIMGVTKRIAELCVLLHEGPTAAKALRLGNVLGSTGSVVPLFAQQIAHGGPLTITDPACTRYFVSVEETVQSLCATLLTQETGIFTTPATAPFAILHLAQFMLLAVNHDPDRFAITHTGLRPGEKLTETMLASNEVAHNALSGILRHIQQPLRLARANFGTAMQAWQAAVQARDLDALLDTAKQLVPGFHPGTTLSAHRASNTQA